MQARLGFLRDQVDGRTGAVLSGRHLTEDMRAHFETLLAWASWLAMCGRAASDVVAMVKDHKPQEWSRPCFLTPCPLSRTYTGNEGGRLNTSDLVDQCDGMQELGTRKWAIRRPLNNQPQSAGLPRKRCVWLQATSTSGNERSLHVDRR